MQADTVVAALALAFFAGGARRAEGGRENQIDRPEAAPLTPGILCRSYGFPRGTKRGPQPETMPPRRPHCSRPRPSLCATGPASPRVLVCVCGDLRNANTDKHRDLFLQHTWETLRKHLLEPWGADLALSVRDPENGSDPFVRHARYRFLNATENTDPDTWIESAVSAWSLGAPFAAVQRLRRDCGSEFASNAFSGSSLLQQLYRRALLDRAGVPWDEYDFVVVTRCDHHYAASPDVDWSVTHGIQVVEGEDHSGICDRFWVVPAALIRKVLDGPLRLPEDVMRRELSRANSEMLWRLHFKHSGIEVVRRIPRTMWLVRTAYTSTTWSTGQPSSPGSDIWVKYPRERALALRQMQAKG